MAILKGGAADLQGRGAWMRAAARKQSSWVVWMLGGLLRALVIQGGCGVGCWQGSWLAAGC